MTDKRIRVGTEHGGRGFLVRPCEIGFWSEDCQAPRVSPGYQPEYIECSLDPWHPDAFDGVLGTPSDAPAGSRELIVADEKVTRDRPERKKVCAAVDWCGNMVGTVATCDDVKRVMDIMKRATTVMTKEAVAAPIVELQDFLNTGDGKNLMISRIFEMFSHNDCDDVKNCDCGDDTNAVDTPF